MKEILLTQGKVALVDDEDFDFLNQWKWHTRVQSTGNCYAARSIHSKNTCHCMFMHRLIMNTFIGMEVDHIDHNGLNNQKYNLRNCTHAQNRSNNRKYKNTKQYKGLNIIKYQGKKGNKEYIQSQIKYNNKLIKLGIFKTTIDAAKAYDEAAKELFGEFASVNFKL